MSIKHLVLSGGGPLLFQTIGIVQQLENQNIFSRTNIESIYGTSSGAIVGLFVCLGYDWNVIDKFMIERPWEQLYYINTERIFNSFKQCGIYDHNIFIKSYKSLFEAKDISIDITMKEFYELTKIDYHLISFEINKLQLEDISHETYPDVKVIDAIHMSACLPIIFAPIFIESKCFIDGGIIMNYPLQLCIDKYKSNEKYILGVKHIYNNETNSETMITKKSTILEYISYIFVKLLRNNSLDTNELNKEIKYEIVCYEDFMSLNQITNTLKSSDKRTELLEKGIAIANNYINEWKDFKEP